MSRPTSLARKPESSTRGWRERLDARIARCPGCDQWCWDQRCPDCGPDPADAFLSREATR